MESVMNFLADNYIWFFVAAGILCFALIGFIIESRKKQKNEFKGESIEESASATEAPVQSTVNPVANEPLKTEEPVQVVGNTVDMGGEATLGSVDKSLEDTMEINDIPLANEETQNQSSIEFYSGPIEMPVETPKPAPEPIIEPVAELPKEEFSMGEVEPSNSGVTATIGDPVSYEQVSSFNEPEQTEVKVVQENVEKTENNDIFNNFN